jgi:hypothetical protein
MQGRTRRRGVNVEGDRRALSNEADENQQLIEGLFAELERRQPEGFTYRVFRFEDGVSFMHVVIEHDVQAPESLQEVPALQAFAADIADRCEVLPVFTGRNGRWGYR